MASLKID